MENEQENWKTHTPRKIYKPQIKKDSVGFFAFLTLAIILLASAYTFILHKSYTNIALETEIERDTASAGVIHKLVNERLGKKEFTGIRNKDDENKKMYHDISSYLNEIRTLNSTRYLYMATKNEENKLIYVVDGLDPTAKDVRHPGDYIEDEMIPYIEKALSGKTVYSQDIVDTNWGPIFTACYPVTDESNGTSEVVGALCIEMDMQSVYGLVERTKQVSLFVGIIAGCVLLVLCIGCFFYCKKRKEEELKQKMILEDAAEKADSANRAKSSFLLNMSHDIRTPMNAIIGFTDIALHQQNINEIHDSLQKVKTSSNHLLLLLNEVLDLSRIESGKVSFSPEPVNLPVLIDSVIAIMDGLLLDRNLNFEVHRNRPSILYVMTDSTRIREILTNLLNNAVKFTEDGGTITFEMSTRPGVDERHIVASYTVKDTGVGMSEEFQKKLFEPFSQEDNGARTQYKGTGLGMAITKQYVELMGGTLTFQSKKNCGSSFTVEIPMELADEKEIPEQKTVQNISLNGVKVLLVEDNDLNAELAVTLLEDAGMCVTRAVDGEDAVKLFASNPAGTYDIILMDIMMPKMNGYQATKAIRTMSGERPDAATIPIIAQSANAFKEDIQASLDSGMNGHISKPFNMDEVSVSIMRNLI